jgi:hypothetical protein
MRIAFDFDPATNSVTNITVADVVAVSSKAKPKTTQTKKETITVNGGSLKLPQQALDQLNTRVGDRLCIAFNAGKPIIATPVAMGLEGGGNLVNKSMTVTCKGKTGEMLAKHGTEFSYTLSKEGVLVLTPMGASMETNLATTMDLVSNDSIPLDKPLLQDQAITLDDSDFKLSVKDGEEIHFDFAI